MYFHQILKIIYYTHETMPYYLLDSIVGEWTGLHKNYQINQPVPFMVDIRHFHFITAFMLYVYDWIHYFAQQVLDTFLVLRIREINTEEERQKKLTHKEKMKQWSRKERKVWFYENMSSTLYAEIFASKSFALLSLSGKLAS